MTVQAWLRESAKTKREPRAPRLHLSLEALGTRANGQGIAVAIHNISATGILLECDKPIDIGETLFIDLPRAPSIGADVVWTSGRFAGCQFAVPLNKAVLSAAQLRGAVETDEREGPPASSDVASSGEPFEVRLRRLRKLRGLTLAGFAEKLGVSKPTVWAWEQARSTPSPDRHEKIADVLGTSVAELRSGLRENFASAVVERSRRHIAEAFGVKADSVRIMIEL